MDDSITVYNHTTERACVGAIKIAFARERIIASHASDPVLPIKLF